MAVPKAGFTNGQACVRRALPIHCAFYLLIGALVKRENLFMWLQGEFQLWQAVAVTAMAVLGAAMGAWCAQAALAYARLLDAGAHAEIGRAWGRERVCQ